MVFMQTPHQYQHHLRGTMLAARTGPWPLQQQHSTQHLPIPAFKCPQLTFGFWVTRGTFSENTANESTAQHAFFVVKVQSILQWQNIIPSTYKGY